MNILIAADYATPQSGNFIGSLFDLGSTLSAHGDRLCFIFPKAENTVKIGSWTDWLRNAGFPVFLLDTTLSEDAQFSFLKQIIAEEKIDILHIHFGLFHHFALHHRKELSCKLIVHEHMEYPVGCNRTKQTLHYIARSALYRFHGVNLISVNKSVHQAHFFARHWFVPNGLSEKRNIPQSVDRDDFRKQYGIADNEKAVLFLGWDIERKGLDIAVQAVQELRQQGENVILCLLGLGERPKPSSHATDFISAKTNIDPLSDWIRYLPSQEDMFACHRSMDAYLSASRSEAFSYGILEAISQNTPVVCSDIQGTSWCWPYSKTFVYPVEDSHKCAEALRSALDAGQTASNYAELVEKYSIEKWCEQILTIYREV